MDQRLILNHGWAPWRGASTEWIEIWKKPYNSGAVVYVSQDGDTYFIGTSYNKAVIALSHRTINTTCDTATIPERTALASRLLSKDAGRFGQIYQDPGRSELIDPGAPRPTEFIRQDALGGRHLSPRRSQNTTLVFATLAGLK